MTKWESFNLISNEVILKDRVKKFVRFRKEATMLAKIFWGVVCTGEIVAGGLFLKAAIFNNNNLSTSVAWSAGCIGFFCIAEGLLIAVQSSLILKRFRIG